MANPYLNKTLDTITKLSFDDSSKSSLCTSSKKIYNFDKICKNYARVKKISPPKSCDGLWLKENSQAFIEFKNGPIETILNDILKKAYDSLFVLFDLNLESKITGFQNIISYSREKIDFILVYNFNNNGKKYIHEIVNKKANTKSKVGLLQSMEGFLYHKVIFLTEKEFMKQIEPFI